MATAKKKTTELTTPAAYEYGQSPEAKRIRKAAQALSEASEFREHFDEFGRQANPPRKWFEALEALLATYDPYALPRAYNAMIRVVPVWNRLSTVLDPDADYYTAWERAAVHTLLNTLDDAIVAIYEQPPYIAPRRSPSKLAASGSNPRTIAVEVQWYDPNGRPDVARVERELEAPGSEWSDDDVDRLRQWDLMQHGFTLNPEQIAELEILNSKSRRPQQQPEDIVEGDVKGVGAL